MKDIAISRRSLLVSAGLLALAPLAGCGGNSDGVDLIYAIATPAAQAAAGATADIPIVGCAITDYAASGLVQDNDKPGTNVTGASDLTPVAEQLEMMQKVLPDVKKVGLLYCTAFIFGLAGTIVAILGVAVLVTYSVQNGIILLVIAFLVSPMGLPMAAAWLLGKLQALRYTIQDWIYG